MRLSLVFYAFLVRLAFGTLVALIPLWAMRAAERHVRFQALFVLVLAAGATALYGSAVASGEGTWPEAPGAFFTLDGAFPGMVAIVALVGLGINLAFGTFHRRAGRVLLVCGAIAGAVAVFGTARFSAAPTGDVPAWLPWLALGIGAMLGGMLMAGIHNAMVLGHFYLMIRGLPLEALVRAGRFVAIVLLVRMAFFGGVLLFWPGASEVLLGQALVWTLWRVCFGFVGPLVLLWMVRDTVRLAHTQAATGLLYVAVAFGLMGEVAATWLEMQTGLPT